MLKTDTAISENGARIIFIITVMKLMIDCMRIAGIAMRYIAFMIMPSR